MLMPLWKKEYIREYAPVLDARSIALRIEVSVSFVYHFCSVKGIELNKGSYGIERVRRSEGKKEKLVRPPAVYSNRSREQIIEELINS